MYLLQYLVNCKTGWIFTKSIFYKGPKFLKSLVQSRISSKNTNSCIVKLLRNTSNTLLIFLSISTQFIGAGIQPKHFTFPTNNLKTCCLKTSSNISSKLLIYRDRLTIRFWLLIA